MTASQFIQEAEHELASQNTIIKSKQIQRMCLDSEIKVLIEQRDSFEKRLRRWKEKNS
jgi:hypothetical protein